MDIYKIISSLNHNPHYIMKYIKFIQNCQWKNNSNPPQLYEKHHICPKSLFPEFKNLKKHTWNKADLTPRQHFIAHIILCKALPSKEMNSAFVLMANVRGIRINSKLYEECLKNSHSKIKSDEAKAKLQISSIGKVIAYDTLLEINVRVTKEEFDANSNLVGINKFLNVNSYRKMKKDYRENQSKAQIESKKFKITCLHCGKLSDVSNHKRWHGDNCKELSNNKKTTVYNSITDQFKFIKISELEIYKALGFEIKSPKNKKKKAG
jgi:hypothetical protein